MLLYVTLCYLLLVHQRYVLYPITPNNYRTFFIKFYSGKGSSGDVGLIWIPSVPCHTQTSRPWIRDLATNLWWAELSNDLVRHGSPSFPCHTQIPLWLPSLVSMMTNLGKRKGGLPDRPFRVEPIN